ncbi:MAG: lipopolysaccharide assembly protein LapB [Betaproteobacteria bacterium]|nr:lipopolysaccharide assembly protein LapB [Burkholderiales bacterium]
MDLDINLIFFGLPLAFVLGWLASRFDLRQLRMENRSNPKAYFKGLNHLLNEQQDQAIDAFIEAVQRDPDTSELHFALGNLFRRRGEFERAVRVHQHLLDRADISQSDRERAQYDLALDFVKAGILDRAEDALKPLMGTPLAPQALLALLSIYERSRDWQQAADISLQLDQSGQGQFAVRRSHYLCELAATQTNSDQASALLLQAIETAPLSARPRIALASLLEVEQRQAKACDQLQELAQLVPAAMPLIAASLARLAPLVQRQIGVLTLLQDSYHQSQSLDVLNAIVSLQSDMGQAHGRELYASHLQKHPSLIAATSLLADAALDPAQQPQVQRALEHAAKPLRRYRCAACGFEALQHFWHCPGCQAWDSYPPRRIEEL